MRQSCTIKMLDQTLDESDCYHQDFNVFILVNSKSGSAHGKSLIKKFSKGITFKHSNNISSHISVYDLYCVKQKKECFLKVVNLCNQDKNVRILMAGGDGTVQWILSESLDYGIDFKKVLFGVLPIGTGNDFAVSLGWHKFQFSLTVKGLKQVSEQLIKSKQRYYDVWDCEITTYQNGNITEIKNGKETYINSKDLKKSFTNYFGIGTDAQITYLAQKINASSVWMKKIAYGLAGIWSFMMCSSKLCKKIANFYQQGDHLTNSNQSFELSNKVFDPNCELEPVSNIKIQKTDECITFINSTSSMEISHIWQTPYSTNPRKNFQPQKVDDGMIEIVSYRNEVSLVLQRSIHMAKKIGQGEGPFTINFNKPPKDRIQTTYVHINGEPYRINNPQSIKIRKNPQIPLGRIRVMQLK